MRNARTTPLAKADRETAGAHKNFGTLRLRLVIDTRLIHGKQAAKTLLVALCRAVLHRTTLPYSPVFQDLHRSSLCWTPFLDNMDSFTVLEIGLTIHFHFPLCELRKTMCISGVGNKHCVHASYM